ncbi:unnamed protein product [Coregonus sp. 'balchen']|nr:unnamed protein product [Coregonus sp. 'balchen']
MADPIMDLFDDTPLFNLDALPGDAFTQGSSDPVEEALKLALGQVEPLPEPTPALSIPVAAPTIPDPVPVQQQVPVPVALPQTVSIASTVPQTTLSVASNTSRAATILLGSPLTVNSSAGTTQQITTQQFTTQQLAQIAQQLTPQQLAAITQQAGGQGGSKIVILKGPGGHAQVLQTVAGTGSQGGKVTFARVLSGTQLRPGMQILSGGTVLNQASPGQGQVKVGTGIQRLVQSPNGPLKQVQLISMPQGQSQGQTQTVQMQIPQAQLAQAQAQVQLQTQGQAMQMKQIQLQPQTQVQLQSAMQTQVTATATGTTSVRPQGVTLTTVPQQGEAKRITLVLQQPHGGTAQGGTVTVGGSGQLQQGQQQRLVLGNLPGKLVLQGGQLAALTQARAGQTGAQPKVLTIQLQVQQQPNQQGGPKFQLVSGGQGSSPQVVQISQGQGGQRLAMPLKLLLQPQMSSTSTAGGGVSIVKVINTSAAGSAPSTTTTMASTGIRLAKAQEPVRRVEILGKQEKANRIVAEAIARAKARGERNIPRVLNQDELPAGQKAADQGAAATTTGTPGAKKKGGGGGSKKKSPPGGKGMACAEKKGKAKAAGGAAVGTPVGVSGTSGSKSKAKINTITLVGGKKRKRNASSDHSDGELSPASPSKALEEDMLAKRRSNRQVKRKKYTEDLDIKITDDEDEPEEDVDVTTTAAVPSITGGAAGQLMGEQLKQELQLDGDSLSSMQFFVENPNEEDAAIVDKVLSMRLTKKEVSPGQYINAEEFFVKYKNYSYMHCEWATLQQLERDKRIHQKLKRFKIKHAQMRLLLQEEEEPFNPDYVEVDRILDESNSVDKDNGEPVVYYLVKWCSLPYEDATWELREDVDADKVEEFRKIQDRQPQLKRTPRPQAAAWKKLEEFREYKSGNVLREYQLEGNCILADEMGLGKTIQSISLLSEVFGAGVQGPFLVIAPLSTITNWEREFATWTDMNAIVYHGSLASRQMIQQYEMYCKDDKDHLIPGAYKFDALITTFEMILSDCPELREISWRCEHKVLLTGTPLQNTVEELFSLLHFLEPAQFSSESEFLRDFGDLKTEEQVQKLQAILKPMMLRRLKEDVEKNLAPKQETIIEVELTDVQKKYYRAILERNFSFLSMGATSNSNVPNLLNTMMELRKCCNHPYLITGAEESIVAELREVYDPMVPDFHLQALVRSAGKLVLLDKLLPRLKAGGHKVLIFSQMRIDGRVRGNLRQAAIDRFSKPDSDRFVFLLCTRAGGLGINLTAADTCVIFDSDWNPQNDLQAQARCHRIGQSKAVKVYRLITRNSYEREMLDKASLKLGLDRAVLQSMSSNKESNVNGQIQQFSKKEIEDLLRKGAYAAIMDEEDEGSKFCEEDIDQILQRRATTITIESEGKGSTFSKASFVATENRTDIALDDPEFWQKWAKRADIDFDSMNRKNTLVIDTPRVRKQTRQFATLRGEGGEISDPDSDDEYPPANSRQSRSSRRSERHTGNGYGRTDCFRVEKHLLVYGWGRWRDILSHARCKRRLGEHDVETICRVILVFCLLHYRLSIPVPRGRKGKRVKAQSSFDVQKVEWIHKYNPDSLLLDDSYRKHLKHQCNKVLLRVRMLYYLRQEVIGEHADSVLRGADARDIDIWMPEMEQQEVPSGWWDTEADRSLLVGVFKHGYEMYTTMRADACLCFLERAGRPDDQAIDAEQHSADAELGDGGDDDKYSEDPEFKPASRHTKDLYEEADSMNMGDDICVEDKAGPVKTKGPPPGQSGACEWPTSSSLTARLRRLITAYQRSYKREQLKVEAAEKGDRKRRRCEQASKLKEIARQERQQRWTRREECDFYRVVSTFGVERIKKEVNAQEGEEAELDWARFRTFARLDKKTDESLSRYFRCFMAMCRRVCNLRPTRGEDPSELGQSMAPITEERASRTLYRISLLRRLRERVLPHPSMEERLLLAPLSSELPAWWSTPAHDRELMLGAAFHGVSRTELSVFSDPQFSFSQARHDYLEIQPAPATPLRQPQAEEGSAVEEEGLNRESGLLGASEALGHSDTQTTPLSRPDGKGRARTGLGWKKSRGRGPRSRGRKGGRSGGEGGMSDSDSDSDSGSSTSSQRSGSSDDSGDSDAERERDGGRRREQLALNDSISRWCATGDRVLINRLESLCTLVLSGQWPTGRRYASDAQLNPGSDDLETGDELSFARLMRKGNSTPGGEGADGGESEFTVKLLKLSDPDGAVPVVDAMTGTVLSGERAPRRRDLPNWLKENPDYERKRKRTEKAVALSGSEKIKIIDMRTGKKVGAAHGPMLQDLREFLEENADCAVAPEWAETVRSSGFLPDSLFHRLLSAHSVIPKRDRHRHHHTPQPAPQEDPLLGEGEEETLVSDGAYMMEDEDLEDSSFLTQAFDVKMEGGDSLSQGGYESSDREALLDDVIMAQKDSDSSSSSED